ncbi:hypothetical protein QN397_26145 [Variovorax sp. RTB1]|uniref:hypothetical protein n=1 Tax=Variovorax sp. RTB1 TaxID=3048631 RepID=UPI002B23DD45|nr:hypothetical protein [Variovorax sp. RTB1]MEB0114761.1 hypothetical protein [Variovorax sp. RTB1]
MNNKLDAVEELLLKLFRIAMLCLMTLALLGAMVFLGTALYKYLQAPAKPAPVVLAPEKEITIDDLKKALQEENKKDDPGPERPAGVVPNSLKYLEETTALYRCSLDFAKRVDAVIEDEGNAVTAQKVEALRAQVENYARSPQRGDAWVKSTLAFTCAALKDETIVSWARDLKMRIFMPTLRFHLRAWDAVKAQKQKADAAEQARYESEEEAEQLRVAASKQQAYFLMLVAGAIFAAFMVLAFYLLFSKIERNLRQARFEKYVAAA